MRPRSVRVEGFLPVWGGFSSRIGLKPSTHQDTDPTDQVIDDRLSPGRPADHEHALPNSPPYRDRTHPPYHHPPHISPKSRLFPQITPHIEQQNPIPGVSP